MKCLWLLVAIFAVFAVAEELLFEIPKVPETYGNADFLEKQKDLLLVLKYIHQPYWNADLHAFAEDYVIEKDYANYNNVDQIKDFVHLYNQGRLVEKSVDFSLYNADHLREVKALFNVFYNAKDYATFAKVVAWARFHINPMMFLYVLGTTLTHRKDLDTIVMPPPYEVCPFHFVSADVLKAAQRLKMQGFFGVEKNAEGLKEVVIPMNYTGWYLHLNRDQKVSYITEDVSINALYYNFHLDYPHWMEGKPYGLDSDRRGEVFLLIHQLMVSRYYLERLSNDLGHIPNFNWREPIESGYFPGLMHATGKAFTTRHNHFNLYKEGNHKWVQEAEDRERRIREVIDQGYVNYGGKVVSLNKPEDVNTLGNLLQGNPDAFDLHHNFHDHIVPSFLENYATAPRDPMFYQFYKRLLNNYWRFMSFIKPYTHDEVAFEGVKISSVKVDKIETYFEDFDIDITNALLKEPEQPRDDKTPVTEVNFKPDEYLVKARVPRLNHKPFTYTINVHSDKEEDALIRVFLGPKYDEYGNYINFNEDRKYFVIFDVNVLKLKKGDNTFIRNTSEIFWYSPAQTTYYELYKRLMLAEKGEKKWTPELFKGRCQYPEHLVIPKGKKGGMTYQLFFYINKFEKPEKKLFSNFNPLTSCGVGSGNRFLFEKQSMFFPLDREIDDKTFYQPNMKFEDINIFFTEGADKIRYQ